jgi:hypothetical protein
MCDAATLSKLGGNGLLIDSIGAFGDFFGQQSSNSATEIAANRNAASQNRIIDEQTGQLIDQSGADLSDRAKALRASKARLRLASAESGVSGLSVDRLLGNEDSNAGTDRSRINRNLDNSIRSNRNRKAANLSTARNEIDALAKPSLLNVGLQIGKGHIKRKAEEAKKETKTTKKKFKNSNGSNDPLDI